MKRDNRLHVKLTDEEKAALEQKAQAHGTGMSSVVRIFLRRGLGLPTPADLIPG